MAAINNDVDRSVQTGETAATSTNETTGDGFLQRRLARAEGLLEAALRENFRLTCQIRDLEMGQMPPEVEHGLASRTARMRPLQVVVDGQPLILAIPARGIQEPATRRQMWRSLHERYGTQEQ
ncbi:hypothetical protein ACIBQX_18550 [Nonomuraea sp. NPDC049714]|uniref:hypothetical protein n=1 Tax=Nonomuraea sp. NPDC049714 TaxID=3364357 RepID=UPI00379162AA